MNFIYDILINFNECLYDFFEWNISDNVIHIRKIPIFKVSTKVLENIKNFNIKVQPEFLNKIENKTEKFTSRNAEKILYVTLFSDGNDVMAVKFDVKGNSTQISKLLIDEQEDVIEIMEHCDNYNLVFENLSFRKNNGFKTRMQVDKHRYLLKLINKLEKNQEFEKLKYLYFECFNSKQHSIDIIIKDLKQSLDKENTEKIMSNFFKLISIN